MTRSEQEQLRRLLADLAALCALVDADIQIGDTRHARELAQFGRKLAHEALALANWKPAQRENEQEQQE